MIRLFWVCLTSLVLGCTKAPVTPTAVNPLPELKTATEANDWTKKTITSTTENHANETVDDDRMITSSPVVPELALFKQNSSDKSQQQDSKPLTAQVKVQGNKPIVNVNQDWDALANSFGVQSQIKPIPSTAPSTSLAKMDLSQAGLADFKYAGLLSQTNSQAIGYVKVNNRLFKVKVGDLIGQGHWRVVTVDTDKLQLLVAGKTTSYERK